MQVYSSTQEYADGFYYDMPEEIYRSLPFANYSAVKELCLGATPAHYKARHAGIDEESESKDFGTIVHQAILTPQAFENIEPLPPDIKQRRGKAWEDLRDGNPTIKFLPQSEYEKFLQDKKAAEIIRSAIFNHPVISNFFTGGERVEVVMIWTDKDSGVRCKGRIDILGKDFSFIADLKTTSHFIPYRIVRSGYFYGYHVQSAMYTDGLVTLTNGDFDEPPPFWFIYVEKSPPHLVLPANGHQAMDERTGEISVYGYLNEGREQYKYALKVIADCQAKGEWEGHAYDPADMVIPKSAGWEAIYV